MNPWSDEDIATIERGLRDGLSAGMIARELGRTRNSVIGKIHRSFRPQGKGLRSVPARAHTRKDCWTDQDLARLGELWQAGKPPHIIAKALSRTTRAVTAKASERRDLCPLRDTAYKRRVISKGRQAAMRARGHAAAEADERDANALNVTVMELRSGMCRWPVNSPERGGEFLFCGHEVAAGKSYCQHHHLRGTVPAGRVRL